jgi:hypothetical protein
MEGRKTDLAGFLCAQSRVDDQSTQRDLFRSLYAAPNHHMAFLSLLGTLSVP